MWLSLFSWLRKIRANQWWNNYVAKKACRQVLGMFYHLVYQWFTTLHTILKFTCSDTWHHMTSHDVHPLLFPWRFTRPHQPFFSKNARGFRPPFLARYPPLRFAGSWSTQSRVCFWRDRGMRDVGSTGCHSHQLQVNQPEKGGGVWSYSSFLQEFINTLKHSGDVF